MNFDDCYEITEDSENGDGVVGSTPLSHPTEENTKSVEEKEKADSGFGAFGAFGGFGSNTPPTTTMPKAEGKTDNKFGGFGEPGTLTDEIKSVDEVENSGFGEPLLGSQEISLKNGNMFTKEEMLNLPMGKKGYLKELAQKFSTNPSRISTGLPELDKVTGGGWVADGISVVAAMPNIGKTTLLIQSACAMAQAGRVVVYITNDMRKSALEAKVISQLSYKIAGENCYRLSDILSGSMIGLDTPVNQKISRDMEDTLKNLHIRDMVYDEDFDNNPKVKGQPSDLSRLKKIVTAYLTTCDNVVFIIDSLQQAAGETDTGKNGVDGMLLYLKKVSTVAPVIVVSTLNRSGYDKEMGEVSYRDLKESGSIEYNSDLILTMIPLCFMTQNETLKDFKSRDYRNVLLTCKKSRDSSEKDLKLTLYAPGCTFISYEDEKTISSEPLPDETDSAEQGVIIENTISLDMLNWDNII